MLDAITYAHCTEETVVARVRRRYATDLQTLRMLGFRGLAVCAETVPWRSGPLVLPLTVLIMLLKGEVLTFGPGLQFTNVYPLLAVPAWHTLAEVNALGLTFYTRFESGFTVVSGNSISMRTVRARPTYHTQYVAGPTSLVWVAHRTLLEGLQTQPTSSTTQLAFEDFVALKRQLDGVLLGQEP